MRIFFDETSQPERVEYGWGVEFTHDETVLTIANGFVSFFDPNGLAYTPEAFIARHFADFVHDERFVPYDAEGEQVVFRQMYRGFMVYSNFIEMLLTDVGIIEVIMKFGDIYGWDGSERPIVAPDEALITLLQFVQRSTSDPVTIWHMDIVYFTEFDNAGHQAGSTHHAEPFYRIFTHEFDMPFLINAYLNFSIDL